MKKAVILMGSPRKKGNTAALTEPVIKEFEKEGYICETIWLYDKEIKGCCACRKCQEDWSSFNCDIYDDMQYIFKRVMEADVIIAATPVYSWYATPAMKAVLDRLVYGMNKYYGERKGPSLWEGKNFALITTCGYPVEKGADLLEEGIRRYCRHSKLKYIGMLAGRHMGYGEVFMDEEKRKKAVSFASEIISSGRME